MEFNNLVNEANAAVKNNKISDAIKLFENALKLNPTSFDVCSKLGFLTLKIGDLDNSINYFKKILLLNPKSSLGYSNLGLIYTKLNNQELALQNYLKAFETDPKNFITSYNLGNYYFFNNDNKNAEKYYNLAIKQNFQHFYPYNNLFQLYDRTNNLEKLEGIFNDMLKIFGRTIQVQFLEGILLFKKKNYNETIKIFENIKLNQDDFQKNVLQTNILGKCYDEIGLYSKAFESFSKSNKITENAFRNKLDKNKFNERVSKRLNSISDTKGRLEFSHEVYDKRTDPVFLIGFPRSGTTLLDTILRTHKSIKVIEEKLFIEDLINELNNYTENNLLKLNSINKEKIKYLRDLYFKKREAFIGFENNVVYIDKLPLNIIYVAEIKKIFPNSKFILSIRNPYDVILSCFMQPFLPNDAMSNFYNLKDTSNFYDLVMNLWDKYQENLNLNLYEIKYEDIINDFDNCIKQLLKFLNVNWTDDLKTYYITASKRGIINTPSYNQVSSPLYKKSISRWKNYSENFLDINLKLEKWIKRYEY